MALDDAAAVGEKVRDDVRLVEAAVLGLDVERQGLVLDVVVEADLRADERGADDLALGLLQLLGGPVGDGRVERRWSPAMPSMRSKASFASCDDGIDAERLGEQVLALRVVRAR